MADKQTKKRSIPHPTLDVKTILAWADAHHIRHGKYPTSKSGLIAGSEGITWRAVDHSLRLGTRGLPGNETLVMLLQRERDKINPVDRPPLTVERILTLADSYYFLHGVYPTKLSGWASTHLGETWAGIDEALRNARRGLPGGSSLSRVLQERRGLRSRHGLPHYTKEDILAWADAYYRRNGSYPMRDSGKIPEAPGETWNAVQTALSKGRRGFPGGSSLAQLLACERGVWSHRSQPVLSVDVILEWADAYFNRHGFYPTIRSGPVEDAPGEDWQRIYYALRLGLRGLPGGSSLHKLLGSTGRRASRRPRRKRTAHATS